MAVTDRSAAVAGGDEGGKSRCCRGERRSASPRVSPPSKRRKVGSEGEAPEPKVNLAAESSSGPGDAKVMAKSLLHERQQGWVVERTAEFIHNAKGMFPAAPATVLYRNQFIDLWMCGRALEKPWDEKWRQIPLVLHDLDLAEAVNIKLPQAEETEDLSDRISKILKNHPGPIDSIRLDHTACPGEGRLGEWVDVLSAKDVQEVVLLNRTRPTDAEFPLHRLRSRSLRILALSFFALDWCGCDENDDLSSLQQLHLAGCRFSGRALSAVVCKLPRLIILTIGGCELTAGCGPQGLTIDSKSLTRLHFWKSSASALMIADAPALLVLFVGITPAPAAGRAAAAAVFIDLRSAPALQELRQLDLHCHALRISSRATVKVGRRRVLSLPYMDTLEVSIQVCVPRQAPVVVDVLCNLPHLRKLILRRVDDLCARGDDEAEAWSLPFLPPCITQSLELLTVKCYRGGAGEIALIRRVLATGTRLAQVKLRLHRREPLGSAAAAFDGCPVASHECKLVVWHEN
ncbi:hypothetical protein GQ55_1G020600 [Panicum hallii var. hallii]|uniref:F-box/LRR-repeat protein 15/At3g58940/PEG3-like LRR domain-containing protein n=1 Tax=Panicum hallii var. hallii TaxID=1504633 RepID=A0A2T7F195_9POAL|nr:hypothetical protein GQ55_1G020600 [Panicum hallii var. hallii]